jgi:hypothetical protein
MRYGLIAAASSAICKLTVYLGLLHASSRPNVTSHCPDRECAVQYLYLYIHHIYKLSAIRIAVSFNFWRTTLLVVYKKWISITHNIRSHRTYLHSQDLHHIYVFLEYIHRCHISIDQEDTRGVLDAN